MQILDTFAFVNAASVGTSVVNFSEIETITENSEKNVTITAGRESKSISLLENFDKLLKLTSVPFHTCQNLAGARIAVNLRLIIWITGDNSTTTIHLHGGLSISLDIPFENLLNGAPKENPNKGRSLLPADNNLPVDNLPANDLPDDDLPVDIAASRIIEALKGCHPGAREAVISAFLGQVPANLRQLVITKAVNRAMPDLATDDMSQGELATTLSFGFQA